MSDLSDWYGYNTYNGQFCGCCGSSYAQNLNGRANPAINAKGIKLMLGAIGKEQKGPKINIDHVKTKNGYVTVSIRHVW